MASARAIRRHLLSAFVAVVTAGCAAALQRDGAGHSGLRSKMGDSVVAFELP